MATKRSHKILIALLLIGVTALVIGSYFAVQYWPNYDENNKIHIQAAEQHNPNICDQIVGATRVNVTRPGPNTTVIQATQIYTQNQSRERCKAQAKAI